MEAKTFYAVAEMMQIVAHQHGVVGPVEFTVSGCRDYSLIDVQHDLAEITEEEFVDD